MPDTTTVRHLGMNVLDRYADLPDRELAATLALEDYSEDHGMDPDTRHTCYTHRTWARDCATSPLHANPVTGHSWCSTCGTPLSTCRHVALGSYADPTGTLTTQR